MKLFLSVVFHMPALISIKQGRGHSNNFTNWYKMKSVKFEWKTLIHDYTSCQKKEKKKKKKKEKKNSTAHWY